MNSNFRMLHEGSGEGGGTPAPDWKASLPEDLRGHASLQTFKSVDDLAKSYVHVQPLIGADKILKPQAGWKPEQWGTFWDAAGRPKTENDYKFSETTIPKEALAKIPEADLTNAKKFFYSQGLTNVQAENMLKHYIEANNSQEHARGQQREQARLVGETELKKTYGDQFDGKVQLAKAVVQKFGSPEFLSVLEDTGIGNDPRLISMLVKVGEAMMDDTARGSGSGLVVTTEMQAVNEINLLKQDGEFVKTLTNGQAPGHKDAKERWERLHQIAYPKVKTS